MVRGADPQSVQRANKNPRSSGQASGMGLYPERTGRITLDSSKHKLKDNVSMKSVWRKNMET